MSEREREPPWDEYPDKASTWRWCLEEYDALYAQLKAGALKPVCDSKVHCLCQYAAASRVEAAENRLKEAQEKLEAVKEVTGMVARAGMYLEATQADAERQGVILRDVGLALAELRAALDALRKAGA